MPGGASSPDATVGGATAATGVGVNVGSKVGAGVAVDHPAGKINGVGEGVLVSVAVAARAMAVPWAKADRCVLRFVNAT